MKNAIYRCPWVVGSQKMYCFGKEVVVLWNQVYWHFYLNKLLKAVLFGVGFEKINGNYKMAYKKEKEIVTHIALKRRMDEIFHVK
eukprot:3605548-Ditylum_brightwellii.AAC.1